MDVPLEIRFHNLETSDALEAAIRERVAKLDRLYDRLTSCRVAVEAPHKQHRKGNLYTITINMGVPGGELMVNREPHKAREKYAHPDVYKALRDAFDAAERQLLDYKKRLRDPVMAEESLEGRILDIFPQSDHGFLSNALGSQLWFHRNAVVDAALEDLTPGTPVHYVETVGESGPQASRVWTARPHAEP
ncbi:MAG: HPF/RaiA family ribosome-associated protein [Alphaproteobacteria bacterium]|nr:HPF/RaiA family ribosome-associated protein [Alphaproteobacteria bacterium]